jgi:hypothetical protein
MRGGQMDNGTGRHCCKYVPNHALGDDTLWLVLEEVDKILSDAIFVGAWFVCGKAKGRKTLCSVSHIGLLQKGNAACNKYKITMMLSLMI